jgi:hypothetical protein
MTIFYGNDENLRGNGRPFINYLVSQRRQACLRKAGRKEILLLTSRRTGGGSFSSKTI